MGIVVFGATFVDVKGYPDSQYIPAGRNVGRIVQVHGGVARNVVEDIGNIGLKPAFVTVLDNSGISTDVINKLKRHGVETGYIVRTEDGLGTWLAVFDNNGDVVASISKRPNLDAIGKVLDEFGDEIIGSCDSVVVEIDMEPELLNKIFGFAARHGKKVYSVVSNMSLAMERRDLIRQSGCLVCNDQEAEMLFSEEFGDISVEEMSEKVAQKVRLAQLEKLVVTLGDRGAVYADNTGDHGFVAPQKVDVIDTTGAGDSFFAGVAVGLTYGKTLRESCIIGTRLASAVIATKENVCPRFNPEEFQLVL
ncbi:MAG: carbohydrate kinase family protein [Erysipelotrichaceae bacterium]|nr:carbohydrate kinase family protein [Erysipelotrichaceae bacterium]